MDAYTTSSAWVSGIAATLAAEGLDARDIFADAGIDLALCQNAQQRWPSDSISRIWELAAVKSGNPAIALSLSHVGKASHYGVVGYAMMSSPDLISGLCRLVRYLNIVSNATLISLPVLGDRQCIQIDFHEGARPIPRQRYEYGLITLLLFCRWMSGAVLRPVLASFRWPPPEDLRPYATAFDCPIEFNAEINGLWFRHQDLLTGLPTAMPELIDLLDITADRNLERIAKQDVSLRAQDAIVRRLPDGEPRRGQIARDLFFSERTFQRRLEVEGVAFTDIVEKVRRQLATRYLRDRKLSLMEVCNLLGYTNMSTFSRACRRWFHEPPSAYRDRQYIQP